MTETHKLPEPNTKGEVSVETALNGRRSQRRFSARPLTREELAQLLWAAQGITGPEGRKRTAPSAGATYPLEVLVAVGRDGVEGLQTGVYRYRPDQHSLDRLKGADVQEDIVRAALGQEFLAQAPVDIVVAADYSRTTDRYGERGRRYVYMEVGHAGQNIYLQAEALGLGTVSVGAFDDQQLARAVNLPKGLEALYLMPVGHPR